ncbi:hypothetical protein AMATHDRAFT_9486 [Amanita thiersii Skay4041]|uniref:Uncharacterized protein n=1 Tax=Amanita thiersii Skay4041 TaxID=703135 RepID=A0A2A9NC97_9AGAR|nr:hypothetical protein AMATHDRAFT_9486 [Amanita thiersii Skay4041]
MESSQAPQLDLPLLTLPLDITEIFEENPLKVLTIFSEALDSFNTKKLDEATLLESIGSIAGCLARLLPGGLDCAQVANLFGLTHFPLTQSTVAVQPPVHTATAESSTAPPPPVCASAPPKRASCPLYAQAAASGKKKAAPTTASPSGPKCAPQCIMQGTLLTWVTDVDPQWVHKQLVLHLKGKFSSNDIKMVEFTFHGDLVITLAKPPSSDVTATITEAAQISLGQPHSTLQNCSTLSTVKFTHVPCSLPTGAVSVQDLTASLHASPK